MTKDEIRMTNQTTVTNDKGKSAPTANSDGHPFGIAVWALIRHSSFGFQISGRGLMLIALVALAAGSTGCGSWNFKWPNGTQTRRDVYLNLMTPMEQAHFRQLEADDAPWSLQMAYVQEIGVYQKWSEQPKEVQTAILHRQVVEGMSPLQVQLAWGPPDNERDETEPADQAAGHTRILWDYGPHPLKEGGDRYERSLCFIDARVLWVRSNP
jgi:hypothetical protein